MLFTSAVNICGVHLGFPMSRPLSIPLQAVFHNVTWERLRYIGFGAWQLDSAEIIELLRRHRKTLRSVRLRGILLKRGSKWSEIVRMLRLELNLKWVSLRGIGYTVSSDTGGMAPQAPVHWEDDSDPTSDNEPATHDSSIDDRTLSHHSNDQIVLRQNSQCECGDYGIEKLKDEGIRVSKSQWKYWEEWVIKRCALHDKQVS